MTQPKQELMSPELMQKVHAYENSIKRWRQGQDSLKHGAVYLVSIAAPLWVVSYFFSAETGPVNQAQWFAAATGFAFLAALLTTGAAIILGVIKVTDGKPVKDFNTEREIGSVG